jgi:hypothetical protein
MAKTLADIPVDKAEWAQYIALMRMHLFLIGETHRMLIEYGQRARATLLGAAGEDGTLDGAGLLKAQNALVEDWERVFGDWTAMFEALRLEAARLPFGTVAVWHQGWIAYNAPKTERHGSPRSGRELVEQEGGNPVFDPQLQKVMAAANQRIYQDGLQLSQRIWKLDTDSVNGIKAALYNGVASGDSAWNIAKQLEQYLGAGMDCPRWTSTRLGGLTKTDIASGNPAGLYSGDACASQGVSYYALRLARNEIQAIHNMATDAALGVPWVVGEQIVLSPSHPPIGCDCEDIVKGGENGDGVYPVGTILLPVHVQCLCLKIAVMMNEAQFVSNLNGWVAGTTPWAAMDAYAETVGVTNRPDIFTVAVGAAMANSLTTWLWGDEDALNRQARGNVQLQLPLQEYFLGNVPLGMVGLSS